MEHGFRKKFMGAVIPAETVERIELELSRRLARGDATTRAKLIIEALDKSFPLPSAAATEDLSAQTA